MSLPKDCPDRTRKSAIIVDLEVRRQTYRIAKFTEAIELDRNNALAWHDRGCAYLDAKTYQSAIVDFTEAIRLNHVAAYNGRGVAYAYLNGYDAALSDFAEVVTRFHDTTDPARQELFAKALCNKGITLGKRGDREQEIAAYDELLDLFRNATDTGLREQVAKALFNKGFAHSKRADHEKEIAAYDELLDLFGDATDFRLHAIIARALFNKGVTLGERGEYEREITAYNELLNLLGSTTGQAFLVEIVLIKKGQSLKKHGDHELLDGNFKKGCDCYSEAIRCDETLRSMASAWEGGAKEGVKIEIERYLLKYYGLTPIEEENPSNGYDLPRRVITEAELREYISEQSALITERLSQPKEQPFPVLSDREVKAIIAHGKKHPWDDRREKGWPYHTNAFVYVHIIYRKWVNRGLTREILAWSDPALHAHLNTKISREGGMPEWLDVPSGPEARARAITDPKERAELEVTRKVLRDLQRKHRASPGD